MHNKANTPVCNQWAVSYIWSENSHPKSEAKDGGI